MCGVDTGTDAMAGVLGGVDAAVTSIGFPIRSMHTVSESGHTGDVVAAIHLIKATVESCAARGITPAYFERAHPRLDNATSLAGPAVVPADDSA